jgi:hypothetical protein
MIGDIFRKQKLTVLLVLTIEKLTRSMLVRQKQRKNKKKLNFDYCFCQTAPIKSPSHLEGHRGLFYFRTTIDVTTLNNFQILVYCGPLIKVFWFRITL